MELIALPAVFDLSIKFSQSLTSSDISHCFYKTKKIQWHYKAIIAGQFQASDFREKRVR